jgi:transposase-like protein
MAIAETPKMAGANSNLNRSTTMTTTHILPEHLNSLKELVKTDLPGAMRRQVENLLKVLMEEEIQSKTGASLHEKAPSQRKTYRNGYRVRKLETQLGLLEVRIPKLRDGSYYPDFLEPHCRLHSSLCQIVSEAYTLGISTRKIDDLAGALGISSLSKSSASRMTKELEQGLKDFCQRPLGVCPYIFIDARYEHVHELGRVVSKAVLVAVGVNADGRREVLGYEVSPDESESSWGSFLQSLIERGLSGVRLVVSDANKGLRSAIQRHFPSSSWQRCTIHLARNLSGAVSFRHRGEVTGWLKMILSCANIEAARGVLELAIENLDSRFPKAAKILENAGEDFLAFYHFPETHWRKIHSTNLVERLNRELKRRSRVVSIFPSDQSLSNLMGAVLEKTYHQWIGERYISKDSLAEVITPPPTAPAAEPRPRGSAAAPGESNGKTDKPDVA